MSRPVSSPTTAAQAVAEAGRTLSAANETRVRAAIAELQTVLAQLAKAYDAEERAEDSEEKAEEALREARGLAELLEAGMGMSHDQVRANVASALRDAHPRHDEYVYPLDVFDKQVVYRHSDGQGPSKLLKRGYSIADNGNVMLADDPQQVQAVTNYEPVSEALSESAIRELLEADFSKAQRDAMAKSGEAMSDGGYPIPNVEYLEKAIHAIGRGKEPHAEIKAHIVKRAKALGAESELPDSWTASEAATALDGDFVALIEKAVRKDGTVPLKLIQPGWGSSGFYGAQMLERDGPKVFAKGTKMYWNHPTAAEEAARPERDLRDLAAELTSSARWDPSGPKGPGLYADAKVFGGFKESVEDLAPHIGVSIRALGRAKPGEAEGRKGPIVESIVGAKSVDFVTTPGAGGEILSLFEAARTRTPETQPTQPTQQETTHVEEQLTEAKRELETARAELARLREAAVLREARDVATARLAKADLPDITRARLVESLAKNPTLKDGALDESAYATAIDEATKAEIEYLAKVTGSGQIRGMGGASDTTTSRADHQEAEKSLESAFARIGLSESAAKVAAKGRG